jgi:hypothetical protein
VDFPIKKIIESRDLDLRLSFQPQPRCHKEVTIADEDEASSVGMLSILLPVGPGAGHADDCLLKRT